MYMKEKIKVLVTGANGYLGSGVVKKLCDKNIEVIGVSRSLTDKIDTRADIRCVDIFDIEDPFHYFGEPSVLLHMAWRNGFVHNDVSHIIDLPKHFSFIKKMAASGCKQIAVMGTMHEVGFFEGCIKENTPTNPESLYGISKDALRRSTKLICKDYDAVFQWLRAYYIVGNEMNGCSIFSKICAAERKRNKLFPFTMGTNQWDFISYDDFCNQVVAAICQTDISGIIDICSGRPEKLSDRVERFIKEKNYKIKLDYGKFPDRPYDSKAVWGDDTKILQILNKTEN